MYPRVISAQHLRLADRVGTRIALNVMTTKELDSKRSCFMNLALWIPALLLLGLAGLGLMYAFIAGCDKV
jgi:hypothetical protein